MRNTLHGGKEKAGRQTGHKAITTVQWHRLGEWSKGLVVAFRCSLNLKIDLRLATGFGGSI